MKTQKRTVFSSFFAILAVFCLFTACDDGTDPDKQTSQTVARPNATPAGGNYTTAQTVTLTSATTGADIYYTLNGTNPTTGSSKYSSAITISETTTLKAIAVKTGMTNSDILTENYIIKVVQPEAAPAAGNYTTARTVTLTSATTGADIYYTLNGTTPTTGSTKYSSPITISETTTLKAIAVKTGMIDSDILTAAYTIGCVVTFYADGGTPAPASPVIVSLLSTISQPPPAMTKAWHTFDNWYTDSEFTTPAVFPITVYGHTNLYARWIVNTLTSIADVRSYLASLQNNSVNNPASMLLNLDLGTMTAAGSGWRQLLDAVNTAGKFVNLDLSACTMSGTSFNPDNSVTTGKDRIVSLVLPDAATSIADWSSSDSTFSNFSNLKSINGANITAIGTAAFYGGIFSLSSLPLQSASFPQATSFGNMAFMNCTSLQSVSFSASANITATTSPPFMGCKSLTSFTLSGTGGLSVIENGRALVLEGTVLIAYPSASGTITMNTITTIGQSAFYGCTNLLSANFPQTTNIIGQSFVDCSSLQSVSLPQVTSIGGSTFSGCTSLQSLNIPNVTNIGDLAFSATGNTTLSITMGATAPTIAREIFLGSSISNKTVRIKVPSGATGYSPAPSPFTSGTAVTVSGTNSDENWGNGFRGGSWNGSTWDSSNSLINQNITVIIERQ